MSNQVNNQSLIPSTDLIQYTLTVKMTTAQVVETSVTVTNNSPIQDYVLPDDHTQPTYESIKTCTKTAACRHICFLYPARTNCSVDNGLPIEKTFTSYLNSNNFMFLGPYRNTNKWSLGFVVNFLLTTTFPSDDDLESGYLSPGSDSSRSQTHRLHNNFMMLENKVGDFCLRCQTSVWAKAVLINWETV